MADKGKGKVEKVMHEFKEGTLKSSSGKKVTDRKQAVAVALSEARHAGAKIPKEVLSYASSGTCSCVCDCFAAALRSLRCLPVPWKRSM